MPFGPGGGSDTFARIIKAAIDEQELLDQPLVIINAPGAGGTIGSRRVRNEKADGYTVLLLHDAIITAKYYKKVLYGPEEFEPVAGTGQSGMVIAVHVDSPHESLTDLLIKASENTDTVTFAANLGAPSHFIGLMIQEEHGTAKFRFVNSGGGADRYSDIKGGHIEATAFSLEEYLRFKPDGIRALAYLGKERHPEVPEIPTAIEQGINVTSKNTQYWWMPKGTPPEHVQFFAKVLEKAMQSESVQTKLKSMKIDPIYLSGDALAQHLKDADEAYAGVDPGVESPLPNLPLILSLLTLVFGLAVIYQRKLGSHQQTEDTNSISKKDWALVAVSGLMVAAFAVSLIIFEFPLGIVSTLFLLIMGFLLSSEARKTKPIFTSGLIIINSVVFGSLFHLIFIMLFELTF